MNKKILFSIALLFCIVLTPQIFAKTTTQNPDKGTNQYYVSNYSTREISFTSNYTIGSNQEGKIVYSYDISPDSKSINIQLSSREINFINDISSREVIYITTEKLTETKTIILRVQVFDKYNNLLNTDKKYLKIIPNNSNQYYEYTKKHTAPRYIGHNLSRTVSVINGPKDSDIISIFVTTEEGYLKDISCSSNNEKVIVKDIYIDSKQTDLNISIDQNNTLKSGDYFIDCYIFSADDKQTIPQITVRYTETENSKTLKQENATVTTEPKKTATGFLILPKLTNLTSVLFAILIFLLLIALFYKE